MKKGIHVSNLCKLCYSDDLQKFDSYLQNKLKIKNRVFILSDDISQVILSSTNIFNAFLEEYQDNEYSNNFFAHPLLYQILNFALTNSIIYEKQILKILDFGISHNVNISKLLYCDSITKSGNLMYNNKIIGRAVVFNTSEPLDATNKLFAKLDELNNSIKAIKTRQRYLAGGYSGLSIKLANNLIEKNRSFNECEYKFLKILEENNYLKAPKYLGVKNKKDLFSYISGETIAYTYEMSKTLIIEITKELKIINTISKKYLNNKVYVHGDLGAQNVIFNNSKIVGIIDWDKTFIGEEYDDFIYVFWTWANVGNIHRNNKKMFKILKTMINTYQPDDNFKSNFANKIWQRMERKLKETPLKSKIYKRIFNWVKWSQKWVEDYSLKISIEIG